jgi:GxxExxY protein
MPDLIYQDETYQILGACFEVYKEKGCGFSEALFQECLEIEFRLRAIPAIPKPQLQVEYKGTPLQTKLIPDFVCFEKIIVELKALSNLSTEHESQVMNYLKASRFRLGMLVNFGHHPRLEQMRIVADDKWRTAEQSPPDFRS